MVFDKVSYRSLDYAVENLLNILKLLLVMDKREPGMVELQEASGLNYRTVQRYVALLEKHGLVEVNPTERKNIVKLTEKGRCVARCLVG